MTSRPVRHLPATRPYQGFPKRGLLAGAAVLALLGGCAITPEPLTRSDVAGTAKTDRAAARRNVAPLAGPLSLNEAIARALKFNLQQRSFLMEQSLAAGQLDLSRYDMLPKLVASAGYFSRDKDSISRSTDSVTGAPSLANPYISSDRNYSTFDLTLSWNVLDFGLSYFNAQQNADRVLIAGERRRKAMHVLVQDVRTAFWRAASAQKLQGELKATIKLAEEALADSRKVGDSKLRNPMEALRYQRTLLETLRVLETIDQELASARFELAQLVNLEQGTPLTLVEPDGDDLSPPALNLDTQRMEELAVAHNADVREQFYNVRVATVETRKAMIRMFPNLNFAAGPKYNDNSYLINSQWNEISAQVSWNLLNVFSMHKSMKLAEGGVELAEQRRIAMQMAVLTQAYLARDLYQGAYRQLQRADAIWKIDHQIHQHSANREAAEMQARLERVSNNTAAIVSLLRRYQALSQVHAAASKLQATLGLEPQIGSVDSTSLNDLVRQVESGSGQWLKSDVVAAPAVATSVVVAAAPVAPAPAPTPAPAPVAAPAPAAAPAPVPAPLPVAPTSAPVPTAAPANAEQDAQAAALAWASAWETKNLNGYFNAYTPEFSAGKTRAAWEKERTARITGKPSISVELSEFDTKVDGDKAVVQFRQNYTAGALKESSFKRLDMVKSASGQWLIAKESIVTAPKKAATKKAGKK